VGFYAAFSHNRFGGINGAKIKTTFLEQLNGHLVGWFFFFFPQKKEKEKKERICCLRLLCAVVFIRILLSFQTCPELRLVVL
jgi:hypothetical protein